MPYNRRMTFRVVVEFDPEAKSYSAVCPELPGCASAGETEAEARQNIAEAIRLYLAPSDLDLPEHAKLVEVMLCERETPRLTSDHVIRVLSGPHSSAPHYA